MRHTSRSRDLLQLEVSRAMVFQFDSKLVEKRRQVVLVTLSWRSCEDEVEDGRIDTAGYIGLFYPYFTVLVVL
jgi:hypothetical protein